MVRLTVEQEQVAWSNGNARVEALAGTGKTTTLVEYVRHHSDAGHILYVVFNKDMAKSARDKFRGLRNVKVTTAHSWAWNELGLSRNNTKLNRGFGVHDVMTHLDIANDDDGRLRARAALELFKFYCHSSQGKPSEVVDTLVSHVGPCELSTYLKKNGSEAAKYTETLFYMMQTGEIEKITDDFYFKKFALERSARAVEPFDIILADEAQDHNEVTAQILIDAQRPTVFVGDSLQQVYAWRYAVNTLKRVEGYQDFELTGSFRFGNGIADEVNRVVSRLSGRGIGLRGLDASGEVDYFDGDSPNVKPGWSYISRTNGALLRLAERAMQQGYRLWVAGGIESFKFNDMEQILQLRKGIKSRHRFFSLFRSLEELREYCESTNDQSMLASVGIVEEYGDGILNLRRHLESRLVECERDAQVVLSTAHKAKGREFSRVALVDNFAKDLLASSGIVNLGNWRYQEELNLLYVAMTRARGKLLLPARLRDLSRIQMNRGNLVDEEPEFAITDFPPSVNFDTDEILRIAEEALEICARTVDSEAISVSSDEMIAVLRRQKIDEGIVDMALDGDPDAQLNLGLAFLNATAPDRNRELAAFWIGAAAQNGSLDALYEQASLCLEGYLECPNPEGAMELFRQAAKEGHVNSQVELGFMYQNGIGVEVDVEIAAEWYKRASESGNATALFWLGMFHLQNLINGADLSEALRYLTDSAQQGNTPAQLVLGDLYYRGLQIPRDLHKSYRWFRRAGISGDAEAQFGVGRLFSLSTDVMAPVNKAEAYRWLNLAAQREHAGALESVAIEHQAHGEYEEEVKCLARLANTTHSPDSNRYLLHRLLELQQLELPVAQYYLAEFLRKPEGEPYIEPNEGEGKRLMWAAADQGYPDALYELGCDHLFEADEETQTNGETELAKGLRETGIEMLQLAVALGHESARPLLGKHLWYRAESLEDREIARDHLISALRRPFLVDFQFLAYAHEVDGLYEEALDVYRKGIEAWDIYSAHDAARMASHGHGVDRDPVEALTYALIFLEMKSQVHDFVDEHDLLEEDEEFLEMSDLRDELERELEPVDVAVANSALAEWIYRHRWADLIPDAETDEQWIERWNTDSELDAGTALQNGIKLSSW